MKKYKNIIRNLFFTLIKFKIHFISKSKQNVKVSLEF